MKDESKTGLLKKLFGQKSSCCSLDIEEVDPNEQKTSDGGNDVPNCCCCSPSEPIETKKKDMKKNNKTA